MPSFEFQGFVPTVYPYLRDVNDQPLGTVDPGDIRMFDEEPGWPWVPVIPPGTGETPGEASQGGEAESAPAPADDPAPVPEPVPAPPAVVPPAGGAFAVTAQQ